MGIISGLIDTRASIEDPRVSISNPGVLSILFGDSFASASGVSVTTENALGVPAFWSGVNFIGGTIASLPLQLFKDNGGEREIIRSDPVYTMLHDIVNEDKLTSFKWRKMMMTTVLTEGRAFTYIERNRAQRPTNLWPLDPATVTVKQTDNRTTYEVKENRRSTVYQAGEIIDLPFILAKDGITHRSPIHTLKNSLGLCIALETYASKFFQNGGVPPLVLEGPPASEGAIRRATTAIDDAVKRANEEDRNVLYMPSGHRLSPIGFNPQDGQMIDARRLQIEEIARILMLPPMFLQDLTHGTFSNTEQQDLHFVKHTLQHWLELWEQEMNAKLTGKGRFAEFNVDGLLRGDFRSRMEGASKAVQNALRTPNELRQKDNLPPKPGGDRLYIQGATLPLEMAGITSNGGETGEGDDDAQQA